MNPATSVETLFSGLSEDEQAVLDQADRFAREQLYPLSERMDREEWWPGDAFARIGETGYFGIPVPESLGGAGMDLFTSGLVLQAFSRWNHALALSWVAHENLCLYNIFRNANDEQRQRYLPGLCSGKLTGALGRTEPGAGSDALGSMATTATRDGDNTKLDYELEAKVNIPFMGAALEPKVADALEEIVENEAKLTEQWISENL